MSEKQTAQAIRDAIIDGDLKTVVSLLTSGPQMREFMTPFGTWLHVASKHGNLGIVKYLVGLGMDVNARGGIAGGAPIHLAASQGHLDVVKYLMQHGAILDVTEPERNPLFGAIYGGHTAVAKWLIESGINTDVTYNGQNMKNMDALAFANEWGRVQIAKLLSKGQKDDRG